MKSKLKKEIEERIIGCCSLVYGFGKSGQVGKVVKEEKRTIKDIYKMIEKERKK